MMKLHTSGRAPRLKVSLAPVDLDRLADLARQEGRSLSDVARRLLLRGLHAEALREPREAEPQATGTGA